MRSIPQLLTSLASLVAIMTSLVLILGLSSITVADRLLILFSGTGYTIPYSCYSDPAERLLASLLIPTQTNTSDTAIGTFWAGKGALAEACYETNQDVGELVGTAFVARDMTRIAEALDDDGLLRYWGQCFF